MKKGDIDVERNLRSIISICGLLYGALVAAQDGSCKGMSVDDKREE